jgi:hypothetical protein
MTRSTLFRTIALACALAAMAVCGVVAPDEAHAQYHYRYYRGYPYPHYVVPPPRGYYYPRPRSYYYPPPPGYYYPPPPPVVLVPPPPPPGFNIIIPLY